MANRRMFSLDVVDTDKFLDMPLTAQCLYFHLGMRVDDSGFVGSPKRISRYVGSNEDDLKLLMAKGYLIPFNSGVVVISDWKKNNYIQSDRRKATVYQEELSCLSEHNGSYILVTECIQNVSMLDTDTKQCTQNGYKANTEMNTKWIQTEYDMDTRKINAPNETGVESPKIERLQNGYKLDTQDRLGKDSIDNNITISKDIVCQKKRCNATDTQQDATQCNEGDKRREAVPYQQIIDRFNSICISFPRVTRLSEARKKAISARYRQYSMEDFEKLFKMAEGSSFLKGSNNRNWSAKFDWLIRDSNMAKVLDGNYMDKQGEGSTGQTQPKKAYKQFDEREYSRRELDELEKALLQNGGSKNKKAIG